MEAYAPDTTKKMPTEAELRIKRVSEAETRLRNKLDEEYAQFVQKRLHNKRVLRWELAGLAAVGFMIGMLVWCIVSFGLLKGI